MKRSFFVALGLAIALQPVAVDAQAPLQGPIYDVEYLQFLGGSGQGSSYGVQVGPYTGQFMGNSFPGAGSVTRTVASNEFALYCVDYYHWASNSTGLVDVYGLGGSVGDVGTTRLQDAAAYHRSAYLASLFDSWQAHEAQLEADNAGMNFKKRHVWGGLHAAIWNVATGPDDLGGGKTELARNYFLDLASPVALAGFDSSEWYVLTSPEVQPGYDPTNPNHRYDGTGQEFLMRRGPVSVPEPGTLLLMLTGLGILIGTNRRRILTADEL